MKIFTLLFGLIALSAIGQTRLISHKSHSGSMATFNTALENNLFDIGESNFGAYPIREVKTAQLDSVIFIAPDRVLMVTSEYCGTEDRRNRNKTTGPETFWHAGRDTLFNHALFSRNHSLDSIKDVLRAEYHFKNDPENTVFVGYDNKYKKYKREKRPYKKNSLPVAPGTNFPDIPMLIFALALLSMLILFISYYFYKTRQNLTI